MNIDWWLAYLVTTIIFSITPGSGAINTMTSALHSGARKTFASIAGLQLGLIIHIILVGIGLGALFSQSIFAFNLLKWIGAAYLIWLGIGQWRKAGSIDMHVKNGQHKKRSLFKRALFVNLTNPKSIIFIAALFPQFILENEPLSTQYFILGITTVIVDIVIMGAYAMLATQIATWLKSPRQLQILNRIFGSLFILIGILLINANHK